MVSLIEAGFRGQIKTKGEASEMKVRFEPFQKRAIMNSLSAGERAGVRGKVASLPSTGSNGLAG
jgi:hypothetical protein